MRIDEEQCQDLPVAGLGCVGQGERRDLVLEGVGECDNAAFFGDHAAQFLRDQVIVVIVEVFVVAVYLLHEVVSILFIGDVVHIAHASVAEGEGAGRDVFRVVVVDC